MLTLYRQVTAPAKKRQRKETASEGQPSPASSEADPSEQHRHASFTQAVPPTALTAFEAELTAKLTDRLNEHLKQVNMVLSETQKQATAAVQGVTAQFEAHLEQISAAAADTCKQAADAVRSAEALANEKQSLVDRVAALERSLAAAEGQQRELAGAIEQQQQHAESVDVACRKDKVVIMGLPESAKRTVPKVEMQTVFEKAGITAVPIVSAARMGIFRPGSSRPVVVQLFDANDRARVFAKNRELRKQGVKADSLLTKRQMAVRERKRPTFRLLYDLEGYTPYWKGVELWYHSRGQNHTHWKEGDAIPGVPNPPAQGHGATPSTSAAAAAAAAATAATVAACAPASRTPQRPPARIQTAPAQSDRHGRPNTRNYVAATQTPAATTAPAAQPARRGTARQQAIASRTAAAAASAPAAVASTPPAATTPGSGPSAPVTMPTNDALPMETDTTAPATTAAQ